jgi:zinc and cadmium transporter
LEHLEERLSSAEGKIRACVAALAWRLGSKRLLFPGDTSWYKGRQEGTAARARDMAITLGALCLAIVTVSVLGGLLPLATVLNHTRLQVYLSFAAGAMLGAAFFHMLPEAVRIGSASTIPWAALGLLALFFLERFSSFHHHETHENARKAASDHALAEAFSSQADGAYAAACSRSHPRQPGAPTVGALRWGSAAFGLAVHSLVGGIALASAVAADYAAHGRLGATALGVLLATLLHKPADALTITSLMLRANSTRWVAHAVNLGFGLMIPLGVVLFALGMGGLSPGTAASFTAIALSFSAGTFLCIALSDLLPELQFHSHDRLKLSSALAAGVALMGATALAQPPESPSLPPPQPASALPPVR